MDGNLQDLEDFSRLLEAGPGPARSLSSVMSKRPLDGPRSSAAD